MRLVNLGQIYVITEFFMPNCEGFIMSRDLLELVLGELERHPGPKKSAGEWLQVCCPFHDDRTPSCGVNLSLSNSRPFFFNCFGCGESGSWNKFASKCGYSQIKVWSDLPVARVDLEQEDQLLGQELTVTEVLKRLGVPEARPWPVDLEWRGFSGRVIHRAGGLIANDRYTDSVSLILLVRVGSVLRGGIKASYCKMEGRSSYYVMKGGWVAKYGLLFFDICQRMIIRNNYNFVVIVEGTRDALRLLSEGIPACAVLGASNITKEKAYLLTMLDIEVVVVLPDNDSGGEVFWASTKRACRDVIPTKLIRLPRYEEHGYKIDPFSMDKELLKELKTKLRKINGKSR